MRDNSLTSSIVKTGEKPGPPEAGDLSPELEASVKPPGPEWSPLPLQLSSYNLGQPPVSRPRPSLRTETLERHPRPSLRTFTSGRSSAEPLDSHKLAPGVRRDTEIRGAGLAQGAHTNLVSALPSSLSELDLRYRLGLHSKIKPSRS